jgi:hypothetical protein
MQVVAEQVHAYIVTGPATANGAQSSRMVMIK